MKNEIIVRHENEINITPLGMDKKKLFNLVQDTKPIADLVDIPFQIQGILNELVDITDEETGEITERTRLTVITDKGCYHSFSVTFAKSLVKAINIFKETFQDETYQISLKMRGSGDSAKAYYIVKVL